MPNQRGRGFVEGFGGGGAALVGAGEDGNVHDRCHPDDAKQVAPPNMTGIVYMRTIILFMLLVPQVFAAGVKIPDGFELQKLDTTMGSIAKPKGWFYSHFADKHSLQWIISKEDSKSGPYKTGFRIQFVPDATKAGGVPPAAFIDRFIASKQKSAQVQRVCPATKAGEFMRRCLETIEGPFQILYSLFWSQEKDSLVITTFGAPVAEWSQMRSVADQMNEFELIGEDFWKK